VRVSGPIAHPSVKLDSVGAAKTAITIGGAIATGGWSLLATPLLNAGDDPNPCATARAGGSFRAVRRRRRAARAARRPTVRRAARPVQALTRRARDAHSTNTRAVHAAHTAGSMRA
jgi:hypothetical protein